MPKNKKLALNTEIQTNQILTNDDEVWIPRLSSILLAVPQRIRWKCEMKPNEHNRNFWDRLASQHEKVRIER